MPQTDGVQWLRWIRSHPATRVTPVAVYSASFIPEDIAKGYADGANYFITKPSDLTVLIDIFRAADKRMVADPRNDDALRSEEHTSELQSRVDLVCRLLLEKKKQAPRGRQAWADRVHYTH